MRAARIAPAIAANSSPASRRNISNGSPAAGRCRATAAATASRFASSAAPTTPVPGPVHSAASPPNSPGTTPPRRWCWRSPSRRPPARRSPARPPSCRRRLRGRIPLRSSPAPSTMSPVGVSRFISYTRRSASMTLAQLVHRGAAGDKVLHHLRRHRGRIGRDAARRDTVVAGEDDCARMIEAGGCRPCQVASQPPVPRAGRARPPALSVAARAKPRRRRRRDRVPADAPSARGSPRDLWRGDLRRARACGCST